MKLLSKIIVPQENVNDEEVKVTELLFKDGDFVEKNQEIAVIETSKAAVGLESESAGYVHYFCSEGDNVPVSFELAQIYSEYDTKNKILNRKKFEQVSNSLQKNISKKASVLIEKNNIDINQFSHLEVITLQDVEKFIAKNDIDYEQLIENLDIEANSILLYGAGLQAQVVIDILGEIDLNPVAIIDTYSKETSLNNIPIFPEKYVQNLYNSGLTKAHVCIGNAKSKKEVSSNLLDYGYELLNVIHPSAIISSSAVLGSGIFIGPLCLIGPYVEIEDYAQINNASTIAHHSKIGEGAMISDASHIGGTVVIEAGALLGIGVTVNRDLTIGSNSTVISGSNIYGNIEPNFNFKNRK